MSFYIFEDEKVADLHPISLAKPAYAITCGGYRLYDWVCQLGEPTVGIVRPHLAEIQRHDFPEFSQELSNDNNPVVLINARMAPVVSNIQLLQKLLTAGTPGVVKAGEHLAAVVLPKDAARLGVGNRQAFLKHIRTIALPELAADFELFDFPHDVVRLQMKHFGDNLSHRLEKGDYREISDGLFVADNVKIGQHVVINADNGPVVLEESVSIGPLSYLEGPAHVGAGARVIEHSALKDGACLGHTTKIGGEIESSIIEPYTNKQHYGFLGHSYLGSWINLGAGTCNSDLKNTYGEVNMELRGEKVPTGMQFIGCVMGDYSKSAINTCIFTGKIIGVSSMLYGFVTTNVPSFVNYARLFSQITELPPNVMEQTQQRMFARRNVEQRPCDIQLLHDMYELTRDERQLAGEPLSL